MLRTVLGIIVGVVAWMAVVLGISRVLRMAAPDAAMALNVHATAAAMAGRLAISFVGSLVGGYLAALIAKDQRAPLIAGLLLLACWGYYHVTMIWNQFPLWYHLTFFVSLPLLSIIGGRLARR